MTDRTTVQPRGTQRTKGSRRGGPPGRQVVGEYVGHPARDAAQAVRRAGLSPGLDRSFGCEADLIGLIVAQEPAAGSDLARNGMVTLYVAAPGTAPTDEGPAATDTNRGAPASPPAPVTDVPAESELLLASSGSGSARRRKPGLARQAARIFEPPPAPISLEPEPPEEVHASEWDSPDGLHSTDDEELDERRPEANGDAKLAHDDFVVHLDDVLGGRTDSPTAWRRVYPRRRTVAAVARGGGIRVWLGEHSLLVKAVGAALTVWILVGLASALDSQYAGTRTASVASPSRQTRTTQARTPVSPPSATSAGPAARSPQSRPATRRSDAPHHRRQRAPVVKAAAHLEHMAVHASEAPPPALRAPVSAPAAPAGQQTQGGLFSP